MDQLLLTVESIPVGQLTPLVPSSRGKTTRDVATNTKSGGKSIEKIMTAYEMPFSRLDNSVEVSLVSLVVYI